MASEQRVEKVLKLIHSWKKVVVIRGWVCYRVVNRPYVQEGKTTTKKYAFYQLTWVIAKNRLKFLYSLFHFTDLKKKNFLVTKSRILQICLACNCVYNRFCKVKCVQSTPHNSKLLGKSKKSLNYQEFEANDWNKQISKINGWGGNATIIHTSLQGQQEM